MDYIFIITDTPKETLSKLEQIDKENNYVIISKDRIEEFMKNNEEKLIRKNLSFNLDYAKFKVLMQTKLYEPNSLSDKDIEDLCYEFYEKFIESDTNRKIKHPQRPNVKIINDLMNTPIIYHNADYKVIFDEHIKEIDKALPMQFIFEPILNPFNFTIYNKLIDISSSIGGIIQDWCFTYRLYQIDYCNYPIYDKNKLFWKWFKKTLEVMAIYFDSLTNTIYVIKKPDEWRIEENGEKLYYRYNDKENFFINNIFCPKWFYMTPDECLKPEDYFLLTNNADLRSEFVKRIGLNKLVNLGIEVDSYTNYPDNELWTKSEYKIIDMHEIIPPRTIVTQFGSVHGRKKPFDYAPFLYMKNQTTGEYHLEGIHPDCKTLYDAIKMRYNGLNIKEYEIKDIK